MKFPSISAVAAELRMINREDVSEEDAPIDVRLQLYKDGTFVVHSGDPSYDTDHRGYWGASSVPGNGEKFNSVEVAKDLVEQVKDAQAQGEENPTGGGLSTAETVGLVAAGVAVLGAIGYFVYKSQQPTTAQQNAVTGQPPQQLPPGPNGYPAGSTPTFPPLIDEPPPFVPGFPAGDSGTTPTIPPYS